MPVFPAVASSTKPPGFNSPRFSASRIIHLPARSFTDWPGFMNSALPRMVQPVASEARFSLMSGVLPIASTTSLLMVMPANCRLLLNCLMTLMEGDRAHKPTRRRPLFRLGEHHLAHVDISRQESGLAIGEVIFPKPP